MSGATAQGRVTEAPRKAAATREELRKRGGAVWSGRRVEEWGEREKGKGEVRRIGKRRVCRREERRRVKERREKGGDRKHHHASISCSYIASEYKNNVHH